MLVNSPTSLQQSCIEHKNTFFTSNSFWTQCNKHRSFGYYEFPDITNSTRSIYIWCEDVINTGLYWKSGIPKVLVCLVRFCDEVIIIIHSLKSDIGDKDLRSTFLISMFFHSSLTYCYLSTHCRYLKQPKCQPNVWSCISTVRITPHSLRLGSTSQSPFLHLMQLFFFFMETLL